MTQAHATSHYNRQGIDVLRLNIDGADYITQIDRSLSPTYRVREIRINDCAKTWTVGTELLPYEAKFSEVQSVINAILNLGGV